MLGTFQKDFSKVATSHGYFPKCAIYQAATFQVSRRRSVRPPVCSSSASWPTLATALGPHQITTKNRIFWKDI